jgi:hypothetical protein
LEDAETVGSCGPRVPASLVPVLDPVHEQDASPHEREEVHAVESSPPGLPHLHEVQGHQEPFVREPPPFVTRCFQPHRREWQRGGVLLQGPVTAFGYLRPYPAANRVITSRARSGVSRTSPWPTVNVRPIVRCVSSRWSPMGPRRTYAFGALSEAHRLHADHGPVPRLSRGVPSCWSLPESRRTHRPCCQRIGHSRPATRPRCLRPRAASPSPVAVAPAATRRKTGAV